MRTKPSKERAESRVVSKYHKLHEPLVELIQSLEDLMPNGMQLGDIVELTTKNGELFISSRGRPVRIVVHDKERTMVLEMREP